MSTTADSEKTDQEQNIPESSIEPSLTDEQKEDIELGNIATVEEYLDEKKIVFLEYERQMFQDLINSDGLLVCAKGISYDRVLLNLLRVYSDAANLMLVINYSDWEEEYYKSQLEKKYVHEVANTANERERIYLEGGIQFISTRILVVDLLKKRIPIELITGIVVLRAHTIVESCQEAFALRLYRQNNKTGFIKAFSSSAEAFTIGYSSVERTMRNLFLRELYIWPRFHATIQSSLKPYECPTVELHVPMTDKMTQIQGHILDIMNYLVKDIKRINRYVDMEEITIENCITKKFHKILQAQLDCIWHQLSAQTKLIVSDLKVLRNIMLATVYSDSVSAYALIKQYRTTEYALSNSGWILCEAADNMFRISADRVYNSAGEFAPESCPKWKSLTEILKVEIPNDANKQGDSAEPCKVLVLCQDARTCYQLNQYLTQGGERYLLLSAMKNGVSIKKLSKEYKGYKESEEPDVKKAKPEDESAKTNKDVEELSELLTTDENEDSDLFRESYMLTMTQTQTLVELDESSDSATADLSAFEPFPEMENLDITAAIAASKQPLICIQTFKSQREGSHALDRILQEVEPQYVIMYHYNVTAIRQLEVHEARFKRSPKNRMKVFFLLHPRTVEEQSYLTSLRREKQAFELLIDTKSKMVIPKYQDGLTDEAFILLKNHADDEVRQNTRQAGGQTKDATNPKIIVDMREFRSDLPCLIHRRGIEVIPVTIAIGDYILTPDICVERKSISDLIGSLNSGRLYNQCMQMQRNYAKPILLIEFDQNKPFHLQGKYMLSTSTTSTNADIVQKLQLLTLHFPKLRLIWSPSPYATAQLFEELKLDKPEPDSKMASILGTEEGTANAIEVDRLNPNIYDFLMRLPGLNSKNIHKVMRNVKNLKDLLAKSRDELTDLLDSQANAKLLWDILHVAHQPAKEEQTKQLPFKSRRGRGRRF